MNKKFLIFISLVFLFFISIFFLRFLNISQNLSIYENNQNQIVFLILVIISALIDSLNPCAFSILLLTVAFLFSLGKDRKQILKIGGLYIFGLFLVYFLIGLGVLKVLTLFNIPHFMSRIGASLVILLGSINILNEFFPQFPIKLKIPSFIHPQLAKIIHKISLAGAFLLGFLVGLFEFPCTGGPYFLILSLLHDTQTLIKGVFYLLIYNLIFILPLVIILLGASNKIFMEKIEAWRHSQKVNFRLLSGLLMIFLGILIFFLI